jgi:hypothetical protein
MIEYPAARRLGGALFRLRTLWLGRLSVWLTCRCQLYTGRLDPRPQPLIPNGKHELVLTHCSSPRDVMRPAGSSPNRARITLRIR